MMKKLRQKITRIKKGIRAFTLTELLVTIAIIATVGSAGTIPMVDFGYYTSIALGPDGFVRISYYDAVNQTLKFAKKNW